MNGVNYHILQPPSSSTYGLLLFVKKEVVELYTVVQSN